jgi:hypothetical protein
MLTNISIEKYGDYVKRNGEWLSTARELYKIQEALRALSISEKKVKGSLILLSESKNAKGGGFIFSCTERKGLIRYKDIPELKTIDLEQFRGESVYSYKLEKK